MAGNIKKLGEDIQRIISMPKDPQGKVVWLERNIEELNNRIEKTNLKLAETKESANILAEQCHQKTIDAIIEDPDRIHLARPVDDERALKQAESEIGDLGLILEALRVKKQRFGAELLNAQCEVSKINSRMLEGKVAGLMSEYDKSIRAAYDAATKIKAIRVSRLFHNFDTKLKEIVTIAAFEMPNLYPTSEIKKGLHLDKLLITDNPKQKEDIITELLK